MRHQGDRSHWFLSAIAGATLLLGLLAVYLLVRNQAVLVRESEDEARFRARTLAESLANRIHLERDAVMEVLRAAAGSDVREVLSLLVEDQPAVNTVFLWYPDSGFDLPDPQQPTRAEALFFDRYQGLFTRADAFSVNVEEKPASGSSGLTKRVKRLPNLAPESRSYGWKQWYWQERFYWLGWYKSEDDGAIWGAELEPLYLLSTLIPLIETYAGERGDFVLLDASGEVFHQTGEGFPDRDYDLIVPVGEPLRGWQIGVRYQTPLNLSSQGILWVGVILVFVLLGTAWLAGSLLVRGVRRGLLDAEQKTGFVANVSHELKTPLTSIRMYAEMLQSGRVTSEEKQAHYLNVIVHQTRRLTRLVNNVLQFGRLEKGKLKYHLQPIDARLLLLAVIDDFSARVEETGAEITVDPEPAEVIADRDALEQVFINLLDNALKYGGDDQGRIQIRCRGQVRGTFYEILFEDGGPGIPASLREKVFSKFFRVDNRLTSEVGGSGIGLSIARLMVRGMDGELKCVAGNRGGACFQVTLPLAQEREPTLTEDQEMGR